MGTHEKATTSLTHGIDGVGYEIVEHLANVVFEAKDLRAAGIPRVDLDM